MALMWAVAPGALGELTLNVVEKAPPEALADPIGAVLDHKAIQLLEDDALVYEFWFVKNLPLASAPASDAKALASVAQVTLLGAAVVHGDKRDYRDDDLPASAYTMRFAMRPNDGNHLGTTEFRYFALLTPCDRDTTLEGFPKVKALIKASSKDTPTEHPMSLSLRPPSSKDGEALAVYEPKEEHKAVRIELPATVEGEETTLTFEMVYEGHGEL
jgi:hypothetical protein